MEKKSDGIYTRMLRAILNKSWRRNPTKQQLYGHLPLITKIMKVRRTRHVELCWRSRDELINDVLLWTPSYGRAKEGPPARTFIQQLSADTVCSSVDLPEATNDMEWWRERVRDIRADSLTRGWWSHVKALSLILCTIQWNCNIWSFITSPTPRRGVEHSGEGINGCHSHNAKLFSRNVLSGIRLSKM